MSLGSETQAPDNCPAPAFRFAGDSRNIRSCRIAMPGNNENREEFRPQAADMAICR